jgi:hypothetical protein
MNLILPNEINFYDELNKLDSDNEEYDNTCLLTKLPLDKNNITLSCGHTFNFEPLFKEVCNQKNTTHFEITKLKINQIKCPYCRQKQDKLLPYVKLHNKMTYINGVNSPMHLCMEFHKCDYLFKSGKNKGNICSKSAYHDVTGCYCNSHHTIIYKKQAIDKIEHKLCNAVLKSGKRRGEACGGKIHDTDATCCKRHMPK